jgi:deoxyribodipyrimidine photo-lyase
MSRDQRVSDNWALLYAQELALEMRQPLLVVFCLVQDYAGASNKHYRFMLESLTKVRQNLELFRIQFLILKGSPVTTLPAFIEQNVVGVVVSDFNPLRINRQWKDSILQKVNVSVIEVDAHNIVPCRVASPKQEFGAYTLRPKIRRLLSDYLEEFPKLVIHPFYGDGQYVLMENDKNLYPDIDLETITYSWITSGEDAAHKAAEKFVSDRLIYFERDRNDPVKNGQSGLSPYLHFGQLSSQRLALMIRSQENAAGSADSFLEELIVRRELSDNYCLYSTYYDSFEGFPVWAKKTLNEHRTDRRLFLYTISQFENAETHDELWNVAQKEMIIKGKMHGYMRMYWAKKILEWTASPEEAIAVSIYLNDKYSLDGRDPNGYTGIAWAIGGLHDRAWVERPVLGKIRYMNDTGCRRKFDVRAYIQTVNELIG